MDNKKVKVLIGDDSTEYGIACANELRALGLYVVTCLLYTSPSPRD